MLNEEEMKYIEDLEETLNNNKDFYWQEDIYELIEIIKMKQTREQKLIDYLEKKIGEYDETIIELVLQNVLAVVKGEKECQYHVEE